jgi:hypothetical protein
MVVVGLGVSLDGSRGRAGFTAFAGARDSCETCEHFADYCHVN